MNRARTEPTTSCWNSIERFNPLVVPSPHSTAIFSTKWNLWKLQKSLRKRQKYFESSRNSKNVLKISENFKNTSKLPEILRELRNCLESPKTSLLKETFAKLPQLAKKKEGTGWKEWRLEPRRFDPRVRIPADRGTQPRAILVLGVSVWSLLLLTRMHGRVMKLFLHRVSRSESCTYVYNTCTYIPRRFYCSRLGATSRNTHTHTQSTRGLGPRKRGEARNAGNWISSLSRAEQYPWRYCCRAGLLHFASAAAEWHA